MATHSPRQPNPQPAVPAALSVAAAVCATLIAGTLGAAPQWKLLGAALAAAIPPLISATGSHRGLRVTAALAVTIAAVMSTYGGFTVYAYAAEQPSTFPLPPGAPNPEPAKPGIQISPQSQLTCTPARCAQPVTIHSTGTAPLAIKTIELDGQNASDFRRTEHCKNTQLRPGQQCSLEVQFKPSGQSTSRHARLIINQNLPGSPSVLALTGTPEPPLLPDLSVKGDAQCSYRWDGPRNNGTLQVRFRLQLNNPKPDTAPKGIRITAKSTTGLTADYRSATSTAIKPGLSTANFTLKPTHFSRSHIIVVTADPGNEVAEDNETNNQTRITITLPSEPISPTVQPCRVQRG